MQACVEDQLRCGIGEDEKNEPGFCCDGGHSFCNKADEQDGEDGHIEKSIDRLYVGVEPTFCKDDEWGDEHGQQADADLKTFGCTDKL